MFKEELTLVLHSLFQKTVEVTFTNSFYEGNITLIPDQIKTVPKNYRTIFLINRDVKIL